MTDTSKAGGKVKSGRKYWCCARCKRAAYQARCTCGRPAPSYGPHDPDNGPEQNAPGQQS